MEIVGLNNAFQHAVRVLLHLESFQYMLLAFGLGVVALFSFIEVWLHVKEGIRDDGLI